MDKSKTCCFIGGKKLPKDRIKQIIIRLDQEVDNLISQGVTKFISSGAIGFEQVAASLIVAKREMGYDVRLIFALPYKNQDELWSAEQKKLYRSLLSEADEIVYIADKCSKECIKSCFDYIISASTFCISADVCAIQGLEKSDNKVYKNGINVIRLLD